MRKTLTKLTPLYSNLDIEYQHLYSGPYEDLSVGLPDAFIVAALKDGQVTGFGRPVVALGNPKTLKKQAQRLLGLGKVSTIDLLQGGELSAFSKTLLTHGLAARPYFTQVIDLTQPIQVAYKSYRQLVRGAEVMQIRYDYAAFSLFKLAHQAQHGHTRPDDTWAIQWFMVKVGKAFLVIGPTGEGVLVYKNKYAAYYASAAGEGSHKSLWSAILYCKEQGLNTFELGEQVFSGDTKKVNISKYKRGFGGNTLTRMIIE